MRKILNTIYIVGKVLLPELLANGKLLIGYLLVQAPWLSDYPGLLDALNKLAENPTSRQAQINLALQVFLAGAAWARLLKILAKVGVNIPKA